MGKSIKSIDVNNHCPYNVIFLLYFIISYVIHYRITIQPHLPTFYHNNTPLYGILSL